MDFRRRRHCSERNSSCCTVTIVRTVDYGRAGAQPQSRRYAPASQLSTELRQTMVAQGSMTLENPQGIVGWYGYENDTPSPDNRQRPRWSDGRDSGRGAED